MLFWRKVSRHTLRAEHLRNRIHESFLISSKMKAPSSGVQIILRIGDKELPLEDLENSIGASVWAETAEVIKKSLEGMRCPIHGEAPTVLIDKSEANEVAFDYRGCCQELVRLVVEKIHAKE